MASARKAGKTPEPTEPSSVRFTQRQRRLIKQAAKLESKRVGRQIGWTELLRDKGFAWCQRRVRRAIQESAA